MYQQKQLGSMQFRRTDSVEKNEFSSLSDAFYIYFENEPTKLTNYDKKNKKNNYEYLINALYFTEIYCNLNICLFSY